MATDKPSEVTLYIQTKLQQDATLGLRDVWYGDQNLIPRIPAAAVEPGTRNRSWAGTSRQTLNSFIVDVILYHSVLEDINTGRLEALQLAERVEALLHADPTMGGHVYAGLCTSIEPGYARRGDLLLQATQVRWEGNSKTRVI